MIKTISDNIPNPIICDFGMARNICNPTGLVSSGAVTLPFSFLFFC
jgi:hypothetical protein